MNSIRSLAAFLAMAVASAAQGATFRTTSWRDLPAVNLGDGTALTQEGTVTLRSALEEANFQPGHDIIELGCLSNSVQILDTLYVTDDVSIRNRGSSCPSRNLLAFGTTPFRFFYVETGVRIDLTNIYIVRHSEARIEADIGAMMYVAPGAEIVLTRCQFYGGVAASYGGGIYLDHATATLEAVDFRAFAGIDGGGFYSNQGAVVIKAASVGGVSGAQGNGGVLYNRGGAVTISGGGLHSGEAGGFGGVLYSDGGTINVDWGRFGSGTATAGGGVFLTNGAELRMSRTRVHWNEAMESGGGLYVESGSLMAAQCSFADNAAGGPGGGVYIAEGNSASFINCTFTANSAELGGGLYVAPGASATIGNTILAGNSGQGEFADLWGGVTSLGHNLLGIAPPGMTAFLQGSLEAPLDPMLNYDYLYLIEQGSPAIDMGDNTLLAHPDFIGSVCKDAADVPRIRNGVIDIGAVEFQSGTEQPPCGGHSADPRDTGIINLSNLLRVIQLFNADGLHCDASTEDGYAPGPGDQSCTPHDSDYLPQDWRIGLSELLRTVQFYNVGSHHACPEAGTEDGYCPG